MKQFLPVIMAALASTACAPRLVHNITGTEDQVKMIYSRQSPFNPETGVIQCARAEDGSLEDCNFLEIEFDAKGGK